MASRQERKRRVIESAERFFGQPVLNFDAPGGEGRASYRLIMADRTIIATLRPNFRRTHIEAYTLQKLRPYCTDLPECLGVDGEILFQSDVGGKRLNLEIANVSRSKRLDLAHAAVASIFRIQAAGRKARLHDDLPHLGQNQDWISGLADGVGALADFSQNRGATLDKATLCNRLAWPGTQFIKWDCRSGNAAIGADDTLRWFDCEYSGARHGAEDFAWLIGDEAWPLAPEDMQAIVADCFDRESGHTLGDYLDYLALYLTFHCLQRFQLIVDEAHKRGWLSKTRVRKFDDVGVHPEFAAHLCRVGAFFAERNALTRPLARDYEEAAQVFLKLLKSGRPLAKV